MGQSIVLSAIRTEVSLESDDPAYQNFQFQQCEERIERLSQQDKLRNFCMDAGFLSVVENGQYFMTKDTGDLTQFNTVTCRQYTLPRDDGSSQPKGSIQGNTQIGPVLEVTTSYLHGKHGVKIRIVFLSGDNTHSWVRIFQGSKKFVMDLNNKTQKFLKISSKNKRYNWMRKILWVDQRQKQNHKKREPAVFSSRIVPMEKRNWIDFEPGKHSFSEYEVSKKVIHLLRHSQQVQDNVIIQNNFFQYIYHVGCAFNLHSIMVKVRARNRQYFSCLLILGTKVTRILTRLT